MTPPRVIAKAAGQSGYLPCPIPTAPARIPDASKEVRFTRCGVGLTTWPHLLCSPSHTGCAALSRVIGLPVFCSKRPMQAHGYRVENGSRKRKSPFGASLSTGKAEQAEFGRGGAVAHFGLQAIESEAQTGLASLYLFRSHRPVSRQVCDYTFSVWQVSKHGNPSLRIPQKSHRMGEFGFFLRESEG